MCLIAVNFIIGFANNAAHKLLVLTWWSWDGGPDTVVRSDDSYSAIFAVLLCALISFVISFFPTCLHLNSSLMKSIYHAREGILYVTMVPVDFPRSALCRQ